MYRIPSILIYMIVFISSLFFTSNAERALCKRNRINFFLYSVIAIALPCLLASLRNIGVGTDTVGYVNLLTNGKRYSNFANLFAWAKIQDLEIGYIVFIYIVCKLNCPVEVYLFLLELASILPVYIVCVKLRHQISMRAGMIVFFTLFYNITYNASRQCIALAFILLAYFILRERKIILGLILCVVGIAFHKSGFIGFVFIVCGLVFENTNTSLKRQVYIFLAFCALAFFPLYFDKIFDLLYTWGIISKRNSFYGRIFSFTSSVEGFSGVRLSGYFAIFMRLMFLVVPIAFHINDNLLKKDKLFRASFIITFVGTILYTSMTIAFNTIHTYRISLYAEYFLIVYFPSIYKKSSKTYYKMPYQNLLFYGILYLYWLLTFIYWNAHETNNYFMIGV